MTIRRQYGGLGVMFGSHMVSRSLPADLWSSGVSCLWIPRSMRPSVYLTHECIMVLSRWAETIVFRVFIIFSRVKTKCFGVLYQRFVDLLMPNTEFCWKKSFSTKGLNVSSLPDWFCVGTWVGGKGGHWAGPVMVMVWKLWAWSNGREPRTRFWWYGYILIKDWRQDLVGCLALCGIRKGFGYWAG